MPPVDKWKTGNTGFNLDETGFFEKIESFSESVGDVVAALEAVNSTLGTVKSFVTAVANVTRSLVTTAVKLIQSAINQYLGTGAYICIAHNLRWNNKFYSNAVSSDSSDYGFGDFINFKAFDKNKPLKYPIKGGDVKDWLNVVKQAANRSNNFFDANTPFGGFSAVLHFEIGNLDKFFSAYNKILKLWDQSDDIVDSWGELTSSFKWPANEARLGGYPTPSVLKSSIANAEDGVTNDPSLIIGEENRTAAEANSGHGDQPLKKLLGSNGSVFLGSSLGDIAGKKVGEILKKIQSFCDSLIDVVESPIVKIIELIEDFITLLSTFLQLLQDFLTAILDVLAILSEASIIFLQPNQDDNNDFLSANKGFFSLMDRAAGAENLPEIDAQDSVVLGIFAGYGLAQKVTFDKLIELLGFNQFVESYTNLYQTAGNQITATWNAYSTDYKDTINNVALT